jgi:hypothetical protein
MENICRHDDKLLLFKRNSIFSHFHSLFGVNETFFAMNNKVNQKFPCASHLARQQRADY